MQGTTTETDASLDGNEESFEDPIGCASVDFIVFCAVALTVVFVLIVCGVHIYKHDVILNPGHLIIFIAAVFAGLAVVANIHKHTIEEMFRGQKDSNNKPSSFDNDRYRH